MPRVSIRRMMLVMAGSAVSLAAFRWHLSLGSAVACIMILGLYRAFERVDLRRALGAAPGVRGQLLTLIQSLGVATAIVGPAGIVAVILWHLGLGATRGYYRYLTHYLIDVPGFPTDLGACGGGTWVGYRMRRWLWDRDDLRGAATILAARDRLDLEAGSRRAGRAWGLLGIGYLVVAPGTFVIHPLIGLLMSSVAVLTLVQTSRRMHQRARQGRTSVVDLTEAHGESLLLVLAAIVAAASGGCLVFAVVWLVGWVVLPATIPFLMGKECAVLAGCVGAALSFAAVWTRLRDTAPPTAGFSAPLPPVNSRQ